MKPQKLALIPLLRQIRALDLPKRQLVFVYPWAVFVCAVSSVATRRIERRQAATRH